MVVSARRPERRSGEGLQPVLGLHRGEAELRFEFHGATQSAHRVLVEHFAVRVLEHVLCRPRQPSAGFSPVQFLDDFRLTQQAHPKLYRRPEKQTGPALPAYTRGNYAYEDGVRPGA